MANYDHFANRKASGLAQYLAGVFTQTVFNTIPKSATSLLEIGMGNGLIAQLTKESQIEYSAYEPNTLLYQSAIKAGFKVHNAFVPPLLEENASKDCILMIHLFEHMKDYAQADTLLQECSRVLTDKGSLILVFPDLMDFGPVFWDCDSTHSFPTTLRRVSQMLSDQDFNITKAQYIYGSLGFFPGYFLNLLSKAVCTILSPLENTAPLKFAKIAKLRTLFARSVLIVAHK